MLRTALRPRWLALLALALALASVFAWLGSWQLERSRSDGGREQPVAEDAAPVPLHDVLEPQTALTGRAALATVQVTGTLEADRLRVVADRGTVAAAPGQLGAAGSGQWVVAPLVVEQPVVEQPVAEQPVVEQQQSGVAARLPVVLGWSGGSDQSFDPSRLPAGPATFTGRLQLSEKPVGLPPQEVPLQALSSADLVNDWGSPLYAAYLVLDEPVAGLSAVEMPAAGGGGGFALQNLSYAVQWWVFAAFAVFLWWRVVRDAYLDEHSVPEQPLVPVPRTTVPDTTRSHRT